MNEENNTNTSLILLILIIVPFALYWQTTGFDLVWDDVEIHLIKNPYLHPICFDNLLHFWKEPYRGLYIPIVYNLWAFLNFIGIYFFTKPHDPFIYHLANIFVHTLNGLLVFTLLRQFIKSHLACMAGALLFLVHPVQVEPVAWVSEFRGLIAAFFGFTALILYIKSCSTKYGNTDLRSFGLYSSISFLFALLSKPSVIVLPLFAALMEYYLYRPSLKQLFLRSWLWIWLIFAVAIAVVTASVQESVLSYPFWAKPLIWMDAVSFYLYKLVFPFSLAVSYARSPEYVMGQWWFYIIWIIPVSTGFGFWYFRKKEPLLVLAFLIFILGFLPVSGLVEFAFQDWSTVADRYLYLSMFGVSLGFGYLTSFIFHNSKRLQ